MSEFKASQRYEPVQEISPETRYEPVPEFDASAKYEPVKDTATSALGRMFPSVAEFLQPKPDIATLAENESRVDAEQASPLVPGVPVRNAAVNKVRTDLLEGQINETPGITQRIQQGVLEDPELPKNLEAIGGALAKGPALAEEKSTDYIKLVGEGLDKTERSVRAAVAVATGDREGLAKLAKEQTPDFASPAMLDFQNDIAERELRVDQESVGWDNTLKALQSFGAAAAWNPQGLVDAAIQQTPNSLVPLATGLAGTLVGGVPGGIAGLFAGNATLETGIKALEEAAQNEQEDKGLLTEAQRQDVLERGAVKGGVITGVDIATLGFGNWVLGTTRRAVESATRKTLAQNGVEPDPKSLLAALQNPQIKEAVHAAQLRAYQASTTLGKRIGRGTTAVGADMLGEGVGEYLGELAAEGKASKMEAFFEAATGGIASGAQTAALAAFQQRETAKLTQLEQVQAEAQRVVESVGRESPGENPVETPAEVPSAPVEKLTPEEEIEAEKQYQRITTGVADIPPDPDAVEDVLGLDELMADPLYRQPLGLETELEEQIQKQLDIDPNVSPLVARRRALEALPDATPMTDRAITWSSVPEQVGLTLKHAKIPKGGVVVVGGANSQYSAAYTQALGETLQQWAPKFLGKDEKVIINLSGLNGSAVGGYQQTPTGIHVISPRELVRTELSERYTPQGVTLDITAAGQQGYNTFTQQQTFGGLTHEFGHAVAMSNFNNAMPEEFTGVVGKLDSGKVYTEQQLAKMPQPEAAVIRDFYARKQSILSGEMTAEQFIETWVGPWKLGKSVLKHTERSLYRFAQDALREEDKLLNTNLSSRPLNQVSALELIHAMGREAELAKEQGTGKRQILRRLTPDAEQVTESNRRAEAYYLQFSEFMAEQFSRYAHNKKIDTGTAIGQYFRKALEILRAFFKALKSRQGVSGETLIKPGTAFETWVDQLHVSRALGEVEARRRRANARRFKARLEQTLEDIKHPVELVKKVVKRVREAEEQVGEGHAVEDLEFLAEDHEVKEELKQRIRDAIPNILDRTRQDLMRLVGKGELVEAEDQLADYINEQTKQDTAPGGYKKTPDGAAVEATLQKVFPKKEAALWKKAVNFTADIGHKIVQLQQIAHEAADAGLRAFVAFQNQMLALKNNMLVSGTEVAKIWEDLSRKQQKELDTLLMEELAAGVHQTDLVQDRITGEWSHEANPRYMIFAKRHKIDVTTPEGEALVQLILKIKNSILQHIQIVENTAVEILNHKYAKAPLKARLEVQRIRELAQQWRGEPFVPLGRYGNFVVKVFAGKGKNKQVIYRAHFDNAATQDEAVKALKKAGFDVSYGKVDEETSVQLTLPTEFLTVLADSGEFTSTQLEKIGEAMIPLHGDKVFSKFARDADRIAGASQDRLRDYANWIEDSANFTSKLKYSRKMTQARAMTRQAMQELQKAGKIDEARGSQRILDTMTKSQEFMMHPLEEWFQARSIVALTYLLWVPKTALLNFTGLFQTWSTLTAEYGEVKGNVLLAKATKDIMAGKLSEEEQWMLNRALEDGLIDQGFGYFMSGLANAGNLARRVRPTLVGKAARLFVDLGMWPFKAVETANRKLTLLSVFRAERDELVAAGASPMEARHGAYDVAGRYTRLLQNDYSSGNRPEVMRGRISILMVFLSYPQYMLWVMSGGFERGVRLAATLKGETPRSIFGGITMRMWIIFLMLSGFEGIPGGEFIGDALQKLWNLFGGSENIRVEAHRFLKETAGIEDRYWRDVIQRGFLHDVLGMDLSGSLSLGKPLPGMGLINSHSENWREFVGEAFAELSGPFGGTVKAPLELAFDDDVSLRDVGRAVPGAFGNITRALDAAKNGITTTKGERILRDSDGAYKDPSALEIAGIGAGFRLADVSRHQKLEFLKREQNNYWQGRRAGIKQQYRRAVIEGNAEFRTDVEKAKDEFNKEAPSAALRISGKELNQFVRDYRLNVRKLERNVYTAKERLISRDVDSALE